MIVLPTAGLTPRERHGLDVLVDQSRLLAAPEGVGALRLQLADGGDDGVAALAAPPAVAGGVVYIPRAALTAISAIVSAADEQATSERDRLGRVPSRVNALVAAGVSDRPAVSEYAMRLRQAAARGAGDRPFRTVAPWPGGKRWAVALTHDLDVVALWPVFTALRVVELARKGAWGRVVRTLGAAASSVLADPVGHAVARILFTEAALGIRSTWFILCGTPTWATFRRGDLTYRPESKATRAILEAIAAGGHEIGLHGSLETAEHPDRFRIQRDRLAALAPRIGGGVRQHFLRMDPGPSQAGMIAAGCDYDATWGFPDRNAFRLGLADVVPWAEGSGATPGSLDVAPFCWMDRTQSKYQGVEDPMAWTREALERAALCRKVEGLWSGIWHPNLSGPLGYPGAPEAFAALGQGLASDPTAWVAPLGEIVAWRRRRRGVTVAGLGAGGEVTLRASLGGPTIVLEDAGGAAREKAAG